MDKIISEALELVADGVLKIMPDGSVIRMKQMHTGANGNNLWYTCKPRKAGFVSKSGRGYLCFTWKTKTGEKRYIRLHRLVYAWFHGDIPDGYEIHHDGNNKLDNRPDKLVLVTHKQNMKMAADDGLYKSVVGSNNPCARINESMVEEICKFLSAEKTAVDTARKLGISIHIVYNITNGKTWQHLECVKNLKYLGYYYKRY